MKPEEKARQIIDRIFDEAGWAVVNRDHYSPAITAVAVEEGLLKGNLEADYLLFLNGKAVGVLEAKKETTSVYANKVADQAVRYTRCVPSWCQAWINPLPLAYLSNGKDLLFRDTRNPNSEFQPLKKMHTPKEIVKLLGIKDEYAGLPILKRKGLRDCQYEAITALEDSFRSGQDRALMNLATGAGKTYTACLAAYRLLAFTSTKRVLFLVDRNNLGKQAEAEFGTFRLTENGTPFNTIYTVARLKSGKLPNDANVIISTIQRLFSLLTGKEINDNDDDESYNEETSTIELTTTPTLPSDYFDLIIIDECHRSIYGSWRKVLEYFNSAKMIGLTATPAPETLAFFDNNCIVNYTLEKSIKDKINVGHRVYRIKTQVTEDGGAIKEGEKVQQVTQYTGKVEKINLTETKNYTRQELNRSIINPAQIKLILETYRDDVYTEMFVDPPREPNMDYLPKTLIFALNDAHASNIVKIGKEVFGRTDDSFIQKITYSAGDSNELIRQFRNDKNFRIAVTVTLVATGTDIKPLEVVIFMRDVESETLYTQMLGRGVRTINKEVLRGITPNAQSKDIFFLVDAVGVSEHKKHTTSPFIEGEPQEFLTLRKLLERITHGELTDEYLQILANRLSRINNKASTKQQSEFAKMAKIEIKALATGIFEAMENNSLPEYIDINEPNKERKRVVAPLVNHPDAREYLLILNAGFVTILMPGEDTLIEKGFSIEKAHDTASAFELFVKDHKDEIEALRIIYNHQGEPITYSMLKDLENRMKLENQEFSPSLLWNTYFILNPSVVTKFTTKDEKEALTNIIQLVRYAYQQIKELRSLSSTAAQRFELWCGQIQRNITEPQAAIIRKIVDYIITNGFCSINEIKEEEKSLAVRMIQLFGSTQAVDEAVYSLSQFLIYKKIA